MQSKTDHPAGPRQKGRPYGKSVLTFLDALAEHGPLTRRQLREHCEDQPLGKVTGWFTMLLRRARQRGFTIETSGVLKITDAGQSLRVELAKHHHAESAQETPTGPSQITTSITQP